MQNQVQVLAQPPEIDQDTDPSINDIYDNTGIDPNAYNMYNDIQIDEPVYNATENVEISKKTDDTNIFNSLGNFIKNNFLIIGVFILFCIMGFIFLLNQNKSKHGKQGKHGNQGKGNQGKGNQGKGNQGEQGKGNRGKDNQDNTIQE